MPPPWLLALAFALGLIVLIPARRLQLAGVSGRVTGAYAALLWLMAMAIAIRPVGVRFLVPILLIAYLAPFMAGPERVGRVLARRRLDPSPTQPPMRNVTPPDVEPPDEVPPDEVPPAG